jgi:hypothetical protein
VREQGDLGLDLDLENEFESENEFEKEFEFDLGSRLGDAGHSRRAAP